MKEPQTIKEAVSLLQQSIAAAMPDMEVSVNISLKPKKTVKQVESKPEPDAAVMMDEKDLKVILNAFMGKVGKTKAIKIVKSFTKNGSTKAADIPTKNYNPLLKEIANAEKELEIEGEAA